MPENSTPAQAPPPAAPVTRARRGGFFSPIWIIPAVAALLGLWLVWKYYSAKGPEITVQFQTADGIIAGKTPILCRDVNIGMVSKVDLTNDLKGVTVTLDMTREADRLLKKDSQIWVVRARYGAGGLSGLSTIVSGNYLELQAGVSKESRYRFSGLENPPVTPPGVPGLHLKLTASEAGGIGPGTGIIYKGISVGKIESRDFHPDTGRVVFGAFIEGDFGRLVDHETKFWNYSGVDVSVGPDGFKLRTGTLESIITGGVTFSEPQSKHLAPAMIANGTTFPLYDSAENANRTQLNATMPYLLLFTGSVRGLSPDAPVEFRGIRLGTVVGISFKYLPDDPQHRVPVFIKIDPSMLSNLPADDYSAAAATMATDVEQGLRASLKTGSLLTGQLYVDLDFQKDAPKAAIITTDAYQILPTVESGLGELQEKVSALLDKFQALPLERTVNNAADALAAVKGAAASLDKFLASPETQALPADVHKDLAELQQTLSGYNSNSAFYAGLADTLRQLTDTLRDLKTLANTLERNPNSIIFGKPGNVAPPRGSH
jgi:paraquat-inducible protein B